MKTNKKIELYENKNQLICSAIDRIVVELHNKKRVDQKSQSLVFTGCSPLAGTTSTCIGLGIALANAEWKTLLIDCDVRKSMKYKKLNNETTDGLGDYLIKDKSAEEVVYGTNIENLFYVPCGNYSENATRLLCSQNMKQLIQYVKENYDFIIFDCPSITIVPDAQIIANEVDGIILVSAAGDTSKNQIRDAKRIVNKMQDKYYGMIVNKLDLAQYRKNLKNYDYYFTDKKGNQKLNGNRAKKYIEKEKTNEK
ncbi:MAG: tyrosine-protein kinase family protein [Lachnospiraceae bacterium]